MIISLRFDITYNHDGHGKQWLIVVFLDPHSTMRIPRLYFHHQAVRFSGGIEVTSPALFHFYVKHSDETVRLPVTSWFTEQVDTLQHNGMIPSYLSYLLK